MGNQKSSFSQGQKIQWQKELGQKEAIVDNVLIHKTKDWVIQTPL